MPSWDLNARISRDGMPTSDNVASGDAWVSSSVVRAFGRATPTGTGFQASG